MTLKGEAGGVKYVWWISIITFLWFHYGMIEFGMVTHVGRSMFLGVSHAPSGVQPHAASPKFLGPPISAQRLDV